MIFAVYLHNSSLNSIGNYGFLFYLGKFSFIFSVSLIFIVNNLKVTKLFYYYMPKVFNYDLLFFVMELFLTLEDFVYS